MKKNKTIAIALGTVSAVVLGLLIAPSFVDWSKYQTQAQQKIAASTGYDLAIGGALKIGLLPSPHASVEQVSVKKQNETDAFLTLDKADIKLAFLPLLTGNIEISSVTLEKPVVNLVTNKDGTDNWKPKTKEQPVDAITGEAVTPESTTPPVSVNSLKIKGGQVTIRDNQKNTSQSVGIDELSVKADALTGPFEADGIITYGQEKLEIEATTAGYRTGEKLPVQLAVSDTKDRANFKWSGVVLTGDVPEAQGEFDINYDDLSGVLRDAGVVANVPMGQVKTRLTGTLTANADKLNLANGAMEFGDTRMAVKLNASGLKSGPKTISASVDTASVIDVDAILKGIEKTPAKTNDQKAVSPAKQSMALVPAGLELPADMNLDVQVRAGGLNYKNKKTGAVNAQAKVQAGAGNFKASIADIPGGGALNLQASLPSKGVIAGDLKIALSDLKSTAVDWLDVLEASAFDNPSMPKQIDTTFNFKVAGNAATTTIPALTLGDTKLSGSVSYINAARPVLGADIVADTLTIKHPQTKADAKAEGKSEKIDISINPPQLPFDLKFNLALGRLNKGDLVLSNIKTSGTYNGQGVTLSQGSATVNGGELSITGTVKDLKALSGVDVKAGLTTSNLENFVGGVTGKPLKLPKPIGAFTGYATAKGDKSKLDVVANAKALGFNIEAAGLVNDPLASEIPSSLNMRVRHNNFVEAVRVFSPGFGDASSQGAKPVDIAGLVKMSGKIYSIGNLKGQIGNSDVAGTLSADMSGAVPSITANINSTKLDVGSLVGVDSNAPKTAGGGPNTQAAQARAPWSREALDTGFLKAMNLDVKLNAGTLLYGTWVLNDAKAQMALQNGQLKAAPVSGKLYGGAFDASLEASSAGDKTPVNIAFTADVNNVDIGKFLSALTSSSKKMADGTGAVKVDIKGVGTSAAALVSSLNGRADIKADTPIVYGMDVDRFAADVVEAFDGGWKGVLAGFANKSLTGGQSEFKDIAHSFVVTGGEMPVSNFTLETTKSNATVVSNGSISFPRFTMDIQSDVKVTQPKDVPVIGMRLSGPLNAPIKTVNSQALESLIRSKLGSKIQDKFGDKLKGTPAEGLINQFVPGLLGSPEPAPAPAATPAEPAQAPAVAPSAPEAAAPATEPQAETQPQPEAQAVPAPEPEVKQPTPQEQLLNGLINQLGR